MAVERGGIELRQDVNAPEAGVDAIGDGNVHESVFAGERDGGLGAVPGEREEARALTAAHDDAEDVAGIERLAAGLWHKIFADVWRNNNADAGLSASNGFVTPCPNLNPALNRNPPGYWIKITMTIKIKTSAFVTGKFTSCYAAFTM